MKFKAIKISLLTALIAIPLLAQTKPNILLIMTDQHTYNAMSNSGNPYLKTPGMDRIAAQGIRFSKAYVVQPLCSPFRASLQAGKYPHETGVTHNGPSGNKDFKVLGKAMSEAGYESIYYGKNHSAYDLGKNYDKSNTETHDVKTGNRVVDAIEKSRTKPFFITASFNNPHNICEWARDLGNVPKTHLSEGPLPPLPSSMMEMPPLPDNHAIQKHEPAVIRQMWDEFDDFHYPTKKYTEKTWREYLWGYYRMVEMVDKQFVRILDALEKTGQDSNTVILFTSDHGEGVAAHHWNQKQVLYNEVLNVPMLVSYKGKSPAGKADSTHLISPALDVYPTLLDFAGVEIPSHFEGYSLKPLILGQQPDSWRDHVIAVTRFARGSEYHGVSGRAYITNTYKYIAYNLKEVAAGDQLFDLTKDPGETTNLARDPKFAAVTNQYIQKLKDWQTKTKDTKFSAPDTQYVDPSVNTHKPLLTKYYYELVIGGQSQTFDLTDENVRRVDIYDLQGQLALSLTGNTERKFTSSQSIPSGVFVVKFRGDKPLTRYFYSR